MEVDEPDWPTFDPLSYHLSLYLSGSSNDKNEVLLEKELPLLARDEILKEINTKSAPERPKYSPFIISTSRGMGKTFFLKKIGAQEVPKGLENKRIQAAMKRGRVLSFDFLLNIDHAPKTVKEASRFPVHLMVFFLCRLFAKKEVDGIHFEKIQSLSDVTTCIGTQEKFQRWLTDCRRADTREMITEYVRLTNIAFQDTQSTCPEPPVFLFDEVQVVCKETELESKFLGGGTFHTILTIILTQLSSGGQPVCICAGTKNGHIMNISATTSIAPLVLSLTPLTEEADYTTFWNEVTRFRNAKNGRSIAFYNSAGKIIDENLFFSLVYASYQIPRLLYLAHEQWYDFKASQKMHTEKVLLDFEESAQRYYNEMAEIWDKYTAHEIAHIALSCGVHLQVDIESDPVVPGTTITWKSLIDSALVFPYLDKCFVFPFQLIWNPTDSTISSKKEVVYKKRKDAIEICNQRVPNLDLDTLFVSYDVLCSLKTYYAIGIWFESFFVASLAVKYYLHALPVSGGPHPFTDVYDCGKAEDKGIHDVLARFTVNFSGGISLPDEEAFVNNNSYGTTIIHNKNIQKAHHDAIIRATKDRVRADIAVQAKASFKLDSAPTIDDQIKISKDADALPVPLLIWVYLGSTDKPKKCNQKPVVFVDASGCCNGLTLDKFKLLKRLRSTGVD
jgi:hypothetical protein